MNILKKNKTWAQFDIKRESFSRVNVGKLYSSVCLEEGKKNQENCLSA